jgi:hypothetical protein
LYQIKSYKYHNLNFKYNGSILDDVKHSIGIKPPVLSPGGRKDYLRKSDPASSPKSSHHAYTLFKTPKHREDNITSDRKISSDIDREHYGITSEPRFNSESMVNANIWSQRVYEDNLNVELKYEEDILSKDSETKIVPSYSEDNVEIQSANKSSEGTL